MALANVFVFALGSLWLSKDNVSRRLCALGVAATLCGSLAAVGASAALALAIAALSAREAGSGVWLVCAIVALCFGRCLDLVRSWSHGRAEQRLERALGLHVFGAALGREAHVSIGRRTQDLSNISLGARLAFQHVVFTAPAALFDVVVATITLVAFARPVLALCLIVFAVLYMTAAYTGASILGTYAERVADARSVASGRFSDAILNRDVVRWFNASGFVAANLSKAMEEVEEAMRRLIGARTRSTLWTIGVFTVGYGAGLALAWFYASEATRVRDIVFANMCILTLMRPLEQAAQALKELKLARAWMAPLTRGSVATARSSAELVVTGGVRLCAHDLGFAYETGKPILRKVNFDIGPGEVVGLDGTSGAGKSSLLRLIAGDLQPTSGSLLVSGVNDAQVNEWLSVAAQETFLLDDSIAANIAFGRIGSVAAVEAAARTVGLVHALSKTGRDLSFRVGERGALLSGGERQRVALARAVWGTHALYVLDEATSALDEAAEAAVMRAILSRVRGATVLVVSHRRATLSLCDRILTLSDGLIEIADPASRANVDAARPLQDRGLRNPEART